MELECYEKWEPVDGIIIPVGRAQINEDEQGLLVTLIFSELIDGLNTDLRLYFGRVAAYTVHEEFVHPWNAYAAEPVPKFDEGKWKGWTFPLLMVKHSVWLKSFEDHQLIDYSVVRQSDVGLIE
jgi:hypothetical protein